MPPPQVPAFGPAFQSGAFQVFGGFQTQAVTQPTTIPWSTTPLLGTQRLSGTQVIVVQTPKYVVEHPVVGLEGGVTETVGRPVTRIELHGFFYSGSDAEKQVVLSAIGTVQRLQIPSTISGQFFMDAVVLLDHIQFTMPPSYAYHYYTWRVSMVASGVEVEPLSGIDYTQSLPLPAQIYIDYTQTLPMAAQVYVDYTQTLPIPAQAYLNYVQVTS